MSDLIYKFSQQAHPGMLTNIGAGINQLVTQKREQRAAEEAQANYEGLLGNAMQTGTTEDWIATMNAAPEHEKENVARTYQMKQQQAAQEAEKAKQARYMELTNQFRESKDPSLIPAIQAAYPERYEGFIKSFDDMGELEEKNVVQGNIEILGAISTGDTESVVDLLNAKADAYAIETPEQPIPVPKILNGDQVVNLRQYLADKNPAIRNRVNEPEHILRQQFPEDVAEWEKDFFGVLQNADNFDVSERGKIYRALAEQAEKGELDGIENYLKVLTGTSEIGREALGNLFDMDEAKLEEDKFGLSVAELEEQKRAKLESERIAQEQLKMEQERHATDQIMNTADIISTMQDLGVEDLDERERLGEALEGMPLSYGKELSELISIVGAVDKRDMTPEQFSNLVKTLRTEYFDDTEGYRANDAVKDKMSASLAQNTPQGDVGALFLFMKMLDENSVVRESEFRTASGMGSLLDRVMNSYEQVKSGGRLQPDQIEDLKNITNSFYGVAEEKRKLIDDRMKKNTTFFGVPEDLVFLDYTESDTTTGTVKIPTARESSEYREWLKTMDPSYADNIDNMSVQDLRARYKTITEKQWDTRQSTPTNINVTTGDDGEEVWKEQ